MEEKPFESLTRGLDRDLSTLFESAKPEQTNRALLIPVAPAFGMSNVPVGMGTWHPKVAEQPLQTLTDRFAQQIAVFPVTNRVVINKFGAYVPQALFGLNTELAYKEESGSDGSMKITIHPKQHPTPLGKHPEFSGGRRLIKISNDFHEPLRKDDPIFDIGKEPVTCGVVDASENLDKYLYGGE